MVSGTPGTNIPERGAVGVSNIHFRRVIQTHGNTHFMHAHEQLWFWRHKGSMQGWASAVACWIAGLRLQVQENTRRTTEGSGTGG